MQFNVALRRPAWPFALAALGLVASFAAGLQNSIIFYELLPKDLNADVVVFYQPTCPHCIAEIPTIRSLVSMGYRVSAINVFERPDLAAKVGVSATPTIYVPSTGIKLVGEQPLERILAALAGITSGEGEACSTEVQACSPT